VTENPYAPPKAAVADVALPDGAPRAASAPLYSPNQIGVAAFLASALAGAWLMAANSRAVGQPASARATLWAGAGLTIASIGLGMILPDRFPSSILPLAVAFGMRAWAEQRFGAILKEHHSAGGALQSWWRTIGISLVAVVLVLGIVLLAVSAYYLIVGDAS
jgi:hypothetical protein